jgi:hypothetical protein
MTSQLTTIAAATHRADLIAAAACSRLAEGRPRLARPERPRRWRFPLRRRPAAAGLRAH